MKIFLTCILIITSSCKSPTKVETKKPLMDDGKYLLSLSVEKKKLIDNKRKVTLYEKVPLRKELNINNNTFFLYFNNQVVFEGNKECLFLLEVFDNEILVISFSKNSRNKYIAGPENFERKDVMLIDINSGEKRMLNFNYNTYLKIHKVNLNEFGNNQNVFAIDDINLKKNEISLINQKSELKKISLSEISTPLMCK